MELDNMPMSEWAIWNVVASYVGFKQLTYELLVNKIYNFVLLMRTSQILKLT